MLMRDTSGPAGRSRTPDMEAGDADMLPPATPGPRMAALSIIGFWLV